MRPRIGLVFPASRPVVELPDVARLAEAQGFDELWVVEDCFLHGGLTAATAALAVTSRLSVGVGLLPAAVRNPAIAAMELGTLATLWPGRVKAAFGHGVEAWMRQIGARPPERMAALREVVDAVRSLLRGERVSVAGRFVTLDDVGLDMPPPEPPPVLVGSTGRRGLKLAAEVSDGVVLADGASAAAIAWARSLLPEGAGLVTYAWLRVDDDPDRARAAALPAVRAWRDEGRYANLISLSGLPATGELAPADVDRVAIAGTPSECAAAVARLGAAGATSIVLSPIGAGPFDQLDRFARDVLPLTR